ALRNDEGVMLAALTVEELYQSDKYREAEAVYATTNEMHPGVAYLFQQTKDYYISGKLEGIQLPPHYDFVKLRHTPAELREVFIARGWERIVAFQTRNPMHRAHVELTSRAAERAEANLLIQPTVGMTRPGDVDYFTRVRIYQQLLKHFPASSTLLSLLPLAMRMAGPREALWHAIIRKNYGATHFIVGRDHAGLGRDGQGKPFYEPYAAKELVERHAEELGIKVVGFTKMVYVPAEGRYMPLEAVPNGAKHLDLSGTELRQRLRDGRPLPSWFTYPEVAAELRNRHPRQAAGGFTVFLTGLSGAGKSTIANALRIKLLELENRQVSLLDGDAIRKHLSSELGYSQKDRNLNVKRVGYLASEITKHGGIAICALIAPFNDARKAIRRQISANGGFVLVYVATPLRLCETRDVKGLYQKARAGEVLDFTRLSSPYETPTDYEVILDASCNSPDQLVQQVVSYLKLKGYIG
ncbi:MAG TPA: bifunctional sulfate adenylyltransferase/adenylylsulfate kinase, partial [Candidatus Dormibacteraeota bacterium]|nr:bifunctional sulfate adenylyltransferase/adenylylsulfate kinase [Candidatus Dormibacteraeota bacterium]